jgi:hypothetical protein
VKLVRIAAVAWAALSAASVACAADDAVANIRAGNWRIAIAMEIPNATGPSTGPVEYDKCLTPQDTRNLLAVPPGAACSVVESRTTRDSLIWKMRCVQGVNVSNVDARLDFKDTRLEGKILTVAPASGVRITTQLSGRYLGPCLVVGRGAPYRTDQPPPKAGSKLPLYPEDK